MNNAKGFEDIIKLRKELHQNPELSGKEDKTRQRIIEFVHQFKPDTTVYSAHSKGVAFIFNAKNPGKTVLFRAELDALPIEEKSQLEYSSVSKGVAHVCGHDGHMSILAGLAKHFYENPLKSGKLILLFQPAEETGQGAKMLVEEKDFITQLQPDFVFALHNLPGFALKSVVVKKQTFCWASVGLSVKLEGISAHAAEPEKGKSPAIAIARIIDEVLHIQTQGQLFEDEIIITIIHVKMGERAFGTSPGNAELCATLRTASNKDMQRLKSMVLEKVKHVCVKENIAHAYEWIEEFLAVKNDDQSVNIVQQAATNTQLEIQPLEKAFRWSEDFSWFTKTFKGALFGLGSGKKQPNLHNPYFNFPDELIPAGVHLFAAIYAAINK